MAFHMLELVVTNKSIVHRKGTDDINADAISCCPIRKCHRDDCPEFRETPEDAVLVSAVNAYDECKPHLA